MGRVQVRATMVKGAQMNDEGELTFENTWYSRKLLCCVDAPANRAKMVKSADSNEAGASTSSDENQRDCADAIIFVSPLALLSHL